MESKSTSRERRTVNSKNYITYEIEGGFGTCTVTVEETSEQAARSAAEGRVQIGKDVDWVVHFLYQAGGSGWAIRLIQEGRTVGEVPTTFANVLKLVDCEERFTQQARMRLMDRHISEKIRKWKSKQTQD